jgi:hypothetical protein
MPCASYSSAHVIFGNCSRGSAPLRRMLLYSDDAPLQVLSFFPVIAMPLPGSCSFPPSRSYLKPSSTEIPTPTCLLTELSVTNPFRYVVFFTLRST